MGIIVEAWKVPEGKFTNTLVTDTNELRNTIAILHSMIERELEKDDLTN